MRESTVTMKIHQFIVDLKPNSLKALRDQHEATDLNLQPPKWVQVNICIEMQ